jgi:uncharacterized protein (DUF362 family)
VEDAVRAVFDSIDVDRVVPRDANVVVKVNLSTPFAENAYCSNTDPRILEAVCKILTERTSRVTVGESNGMRYDTEDAFEVSGYYPILEKYGVKAMSFTKDEWVETGDRLLEGWPLPRTIMEADVFITLPVLKTHATTVFTGSLKNQFGCFPQYNRILLHPKLDEVLVAVNRHLKPALSIMDGLVAMEGRGPINGKPREIGVVLGSTDLVALDATAMRLVGIDPWTCRHLRLAEKAGLGVIAEDRIEVDGPFEEFACRFEPADKDLPIRMLGVISHSRFLTEKLIMNPEAFYPLRSAAMVFRDMRDSVLRVVGRGR